jgi:hypothetical protein
MPKTEIDYSNTIIYKITCKDPEIKDVYVGHTTNFVQRKHAHKQSCNNPKTPNYNCKVYNTIREQGGWNNWKMEIINFSNCYDHYEARQKEQEYFISLNANLNSIEPMPKPKIVVVKPVKIKQLHICNVCNINCHTMKGLETHNETNKHKGMQIKLTECENDVIQLGFENVKTLVITTPTSDKYTCEICTFECCKLSNWTKHVSTSKHINRTALNELEQQKCKKIFACKHCDKEYKARNSLWYHENKCMTNVVKEESIEKSPDNQTLIDFLIKQNSDLQKQILDICKNQLLEKVEQKA